MTFCHRDAPLLLWVKNAKSSSKPKSLKFLKKRKTIMSIKRNSYQIPKFIRRMVGPSRSREVLPWGNFKIPADNIRLPSSSG
jgi:hypothetical protein